MVVSNACHLKTLKILLFLLQVSVDGFSCDLMRLKAASTLAIIAKVNTEIYFGA